MTFEGLQPINDPSVGNWIAPRLCGFGGRVCCIVPRGFSGYVRVLHPAEDETGHAVTWAEVCERTSRIPHALMQWRSIARVTEQLRDGFLTTTSEWAGRPPGEGRLPPELLTRLLDVLGSFTEVGDYYHALWEGWGWASPRPRLHHPERAYLLFRGPLHAALHVGKQYGQRFALQSPQLMWPADRSWCLATEVDFDSTLIGGPRALIEAVLHAPGVEAWPVSENDDLTIRGDLLNG